MHDDLRRLARSLGLDDEDLIEAAAVHDAALPDGTAPAILALRLGVAGAGRPAVRSVVLPAVLERTRSDDGAPHAAGVRAHLAALDAWHLRHAPFDAVEALEDALASLEAADTDAARAYSGRVLDTLGQLLSQQGLLREARDAFERALESKREADDRLGIAITQGNLGRMLSALGAHAEAARHFADDLAFAEASGGPAVVRAALSTELAACRMEIGDFDGAAEALDRGDALGEETHDPVVRGFVAAYRARLALRQGDVGAARRALRSVPTDDLPADAHELRGLVAFVTGEAAWASDDVEGALRAFADADARFDRSARVNPVEHAQLLLARATATASTGRTGEAARHLREALRRLDATTAEPLRARVDEELRALDETAWLLHSIGRFVGHGQIEGLLEEAGRGGFRGHAENVSVLFSDLRGFTRVSELLAPDVLVELLNRYFSNMTRCVEGFGGRVDKFIGDAVMAVFPGDDGDDASRAVDAARAMRAELARFNRFLPADLPRFAVGIAVHSGPVIAGLVGSPQKRSLTVLGDTVNTASRLEGMTKQLDAPLLVSDDTAARIGEPTARGLVPLGRIRPYGREQALGVFRIGRPGAALDELRAASSTALDAFAAREFTTAASRFAALRDRVGSGAGRGAYALHHAEATRLAAEPPGEAWEPVVPLEEK